MKAAEMCRAFGLTMVELGRLVGKPTATLRNWHRDSPELFAVVVAGAAMIKKRKGK